MHAGALRGSSFSRRKKARPGPSLRTHPLGMSMAIRPSSVASISRGSCGCARLSRTKRALRRLMTSERCREMVAESAALLMDRGRKAADFENEISHHCKIEDKDQQLERAEAMNQLIDFQWDEASGRNDGEDFRPTFAEIQADTFCEVQRRVDERSQADGAKFVLVDKRKLVEQQVHVVVVGIDPEQVRPVLGFMHFLTRQRLDRNAYGEQRESLEEFERSDDHQAARMRVGVRSMASHRMWIDCSSEQTVRSLLRRKVQPLE